MNIVNACIAILRSCGLFDVECEIRESHVQSLGSSGQPIQYLLPVPHDHTVATFQLPFTASPGLAIAPVGSSSEGTLGLFLKPGVTNPYAQSIWALTCRHVALPSESPENPYKYKPATGQQCRNILLPTNGTLLRIKEHATTAMNLYAIQKSHVEARLSQCKPEEEQQLKNKKEHWTVAFGESREFVEDLLPTFQSEESRVSGHVVFAAPVQVADPLEAMDMVGPRRDWALLELDKAKFPEPITNIVDIAAGIHHELYTYNLGTQLRGHPAGPYFEMPTSGKLRLGQTVPLSELRTPTVSDGNGDPCLFVGKRGGTSGMTWGCSNELKSVVWNDDTNSPSMEWCVVPGIKMPQTKVFSEPGDSGSAVFDVTGRVVGIINGGTRGACGLHSMDVTYVTPMVWLQQDMRKYGYSFEMA